MSNTNQIELTHAEFKKDYVESYFDGKILYEQDELSVVLRAHLLVEILINQLLESNLKKGDILKNKDFTFSMKLTLADSMGIIPPKVLPSVKQLNSIRNKFAHKIKSKLKDLDIREIIKFCKENSSKKDILEQYTEDKLIFGVAIGYLLGRLSVPAFRNHPIPL